MKKKKVENIEIFYQQEDEIEELLLLIKNNLSFLSSFLPKKVIFQDEPLKIENDTLYIHQTIEYIDQLINVLETSPLLKMIKENINQIYILYTEYLLKTEDKNNSYESLFKGVKLDYIEALIAFFYYSNREDFISYLYGYKTKEQNDRIDWIRNISRVNTFKCFLNVNNRYQKIENQKVSNFIYHHLEEFDDFYFSRNNDKKYSFSKMSQKELYLILSSFLKEIEPSQKWYHIFEDIQKNNKIKIRYTNKLEECNSSEYNDGILYLELNGNTHDIKILCHEVMHYIVKENYDDKEYHSSLEELPSIYYEKKAIEYLKRYSIKEDEIDALLNIRKETLKKNYSIMTELLIFLEYQKRKDLTEEEIRRIIKDLYPKYVKKEEDKVIEEDTLLLIKYREDVESYFEYLLSDYFSDKIGNLINDNEIMIDVTNHLKSINLELLLVQMNHSKRKVKR